MPNPSSFSQVFGINKSQHELDFIDIPLDHGDIPLFIDPYSIAVKKDEWSINAHNDIIHFFQVVVDAIRRGDQVAAMNALKDLKEPNYTRLGLSTGDQPRGRGVTGETAIDLYHALANSTAVRTGFLHELEDCELLIPGIGRDKISDITTNVIKRYLVIYTQQQCALFNIPTHEVASGFFWDEAQGCWIDEYANLPVSGNLPIILVPKRIAKRKLLLESSEYYNHFVLNFLQEQEYRAHSSLVRTLKSGELRPPTKKSLKKLQPPTKDYLYQFSSEHPEVMQKYKDKKSADDIPLSNPQILEVRDTEPRNLDPESLKSGLRMIKAGYAGATAYHNHMIGVLTDIFYPALSNPDKEREIHSGRKRIDIVYTNSSKKGFFELLVRVKKITAPYIFVECKNYSTNPENPELDQLSGRFSPLRGQFGMLVCRTINDKELFYKRCHDTATDQRGYILALDDADICNLIDLRASNNESEIDNYLDTLFKKIVL